MLLARLVLLVYFFSSFSCLFRIARPHLTTRRSMTIAAARKEKLLPGCQLRLSQSLYIRPPLCVNRLACTRRRWWQSRSSVACAPPCAVHPWQHNVTQIELPGWHIVDKSFTNDSTIYLSLSLSLLSILTATPHLLRTNVVQIVQQQQPAGQLQQPSFRLIHLARMFPFHTLYLRHDTLSINHLINDMWNIHLFSFFIQK